MLNRQYGVAASSSIVKVAHPEDSQPNERIRGRNKHLPPKLNTVRPPRFDRIASNPSRMSTQTARRGTWNQKLPIRSRQEPSAWSKTNYSGPHALSRQSDTRISIVPVAPNWKPTSSLTTATHPSEHSTWAPRYRSISPKLPPEPIRRRTPQDPPRPKDHHPVGPADSLPRSSASLPLPGRKRKAQEAPSSTPPPLQKLKVEQPNSSPPRQPVIKPEPLSPALITRRLVTEACSFWPTPDNCRNSVSTHSDNRKEFARVKSKELSRLGLKRTKALFREDGLVIEWRSEVPVWNDTLLPERPQQRSTTPSKKPSSVDSSANTNPETLKRKQDVVEIIDVDALPTPSLPTKKLRSSGPGPPTASAPKPELKTPSPKKVNTAKHWSAGLSKTDIRRLGRDAEASSLKQRPPPSSSTVVPVTPPNTCDDTMILHSATPVTPRPKRLPLPTRLTPAERKIVAAPYATTAFSSPTRGKRAIATVVTAANTSQSPGSPATAGPNPTQEVLKPLVIDVSPSRHSSTALVEFTNKGDTPLGADRSMDVHVDTSSVVGTSLSLDVERQHVDDILGHNNDEAPAQTSQTDPQFTTKPDGGKHDAASLSEVESQEIERLCKEDVSGDFPEYEMAEDFLRRFITLFDTDRSELKMAYSNDAFLSCRVPDTQPESSMAPGTISSSSSSKSTLHVGRSEIIDKLNDLVDYHFSPAGVPNNTIYYDIAVLSQEVINSGPRHGNSTDKEAIGGVLVTLHSQIACSHPSSAGVGHTMTLHQSFVLRRQTELDDSSSDGMISKRPWPLIVVSHQMILQDGPSLPSDQLNDSE